MIVHSIYPYDETRVQREAEALVERGHQVDVICLRGGTESSVEETGGVTAYRLPVRRNKHRGALGQFLEYLTFMLLASIRLTRLHMRHHYDTVQVHNLPDFLVLAALVPRLTGSKIILDLHDLMPEFYCTKFGTDMSSLPVRLILLQEQLSCRFAHHVITVTESWRQTLIQRGVAAAKCSVVMNLADTRHFQATGVAVDEPTGLKLIYHGTVTRRYGLDLLLRALARIRDQIPGLHLTVHGRGEYYDEICKLIRSLSLESIVSIDNAFLSAADLAALIQSNQVGVVPYRRDVFTDGILPTKLLEYAALERAVIAARTPAITSYFDENMVEFFRAEDVNDLAQRILYLAQHPARRRELAHSVARFNAQYNWNVQRERYVSQMERLVPAKLAGLKNRVAK